MQWNVVHSSKCQRLRYFCLFVYVNVHSAAIYVIIVLFITQNVRQATIAVLIADLRFNKY